MLQDDIQEAVWRTILRGPRPPSNTWEMRNKSDASKPHSKVVKGEPKKDPPVPKKPQVQSKVRSEGAKTPLDSHQQRFRRVRQAMRGERGVGERQVEAAVESIRRLASRVVFIKGEDIPRAIRCHWSALNVPLLWAAAEDDRRCPMMVWLMEVTQTAPNVVVAGVPMAGTDAVMAGWDALRNSMRRMGIGSREQFAEWIHNEGFPMPRWGGYISARVQERIVNFAIAQDARVFSSRICVRVDHVGTV